MTALAHQLTRLAWPAVGGHGAADEVIFTGSGSLPSVFPVTDLASAAVAAASLSIAELVRRAGGGTATVTVDRRLSSIWFGTSIRPVGWSLPSPWDPIAGDYRTQDGWIRLHTNAPHHRAAAEHVLGKHGEKEGMVQAVMQWGKAGLEAAIIEAGGCAAEMRTVAEWQQHPQGRAVAAEPLAHIAATDRAATPNWSMRADRPLQGLRVLDLTRVLAGPVASRFLAGYGAEVLRIDPPDWNEPGVVPEVTLGKRCARLDLHSPDGRSIFETLLAKADVLLHGYRPGALDGLGFDTATRRKLRPGLIDVCLDAYGWSGPWAARRGFDSLVQMSSGIADSGMRQWGAQKPVPLPVQALDHATGYLMAAAAICGVTRRLTHGNGTEARLSLTRTARLLTDLGKGHDEPSLAPETEADRSLEIEATDWGEARRVIPPVRIQDIRMRWDHPATNLGMAPARWLSG